MIKAIETVYKGYRFRSRLEARWAVFFDALGIEWEYEKEGFDLGDGLLYLPDFWLPKHGYWCEVKGELVPGDPQAVAAISKIRRLQEDNAPVVLVVGPPGVPYHADLYAHDLCDSGGGTYFEEVAWGKCSTCGRVDIRPLNDRREDRVITNHKWEHVGWCGCDWGRRHELYVPITEAEEAARSARFEHGQTPRGIEMQPEPVIPVIDYPVPKPPPSTTNLEHLRRLWSTIARHVKESHPTWAEVLLKPALCRPVMATGKMVTIAFAIPELVSIFRQSKARSVVEQALYQVLGYKCLVEVVTFEQASRMAVEG